jgi:PIN domain nuclease of toxin-antitoxin system
VGRREVILLDTHVWLWWAAEPTRLSPRARRALLRATRLGVSVISCWEAAMLAYRGRIQSDSHLLSWQEKALAVEKVEVVPLTPAIAVRAAGLQAARGGDPADWLIAATAQELQVRLVTKDETLAEAGLVETVW